MKRKIRVLAMAAGVILAGFVSLPSAWADSIPVTFSTTGSFDGSSSYQAGVTNGFTMTFTGVSSTVNAPDMTVNFGTLTATQNGNGASEATNQPFELHINQTIPSPGGNLTFAAEFTGKITGGGQGPITITFSSFSGTIVGGAADIVYSLSPTTYTFATTSGDGQQASVNLMGSIVARGLTTVPEPSTILLLWIGLAGVGAAVRFWKN